MRMNSKLFVLVASAAIALTGCSSGQSPDSMNAALAPDTTAEATPLPGALGEIKTDVKSVKTDVPEVDRGLIISLPDAKSYEVDLNEKIQLTVGGLPPEEDADIYLMYSMEGNPQATLNLKSTQVKADGSVLEYVNVPKNLAPGSFSLVLETEDKLMYSTTLNIKE